MLHIVHAVISFTCLALCGVALYFSETNGFYSMTVTVGAVKSKAEYGMFSFCSSVTGSSETCSGVSFSAATDATSGKVCSTQRQQERRWMGLQIATIGAGVMQFLLCFAVVGNSSSLALARIIMSILTFLAWCGHITLTCIIFLLWTGCNDKLCSLTTASCSEGFTWPWWLMVGGAALSLGNVVVAIVAKTMAVAESSPSEPTLEDGQGQQQQQQGGGNAAPPTQKADLGAGGTEGGGGGGGGTSPTKQKQSPQAQVDNGSQHQDDDQPELPEGDWVYDEESGMYWSDENYMFLHLESGQFYDPETDMWYSSELDEWYKADDYEE